MTLKISKNVWLFLSSLAVAVILLWAIFSGTNIGKALAQTELVYNNAGSIASSLDFFYSDQNRFPTVPEFEDQNIMGNYFNSFPPAELASQNCSSSFIYKRISFTQYELNFCLPLSFSGYKKGWNRISESK